MKKFLSIRSIGRPNVAAIINFGKKLPIVNICCLAALSLLLVTPRTEAMPQESNTAILSSLFKPNNAISSKWAVPSPSCSTRTACIADANFQQEFVNFVNFIHTRYPSAQVPSAERLQRHVCHTLSPPGGATGVNEHEEDNLDSAKMGQWLAAYISYSYWSTQAGMTPYQTAPVWWCFLDDATNYVIKDAEQLVGTTNIIASFAGLGKSVASGGQGFYVNQASVTDIYPAISLDPGFYVAQTYTNKELIAIDVAAAGTTKPLSQYQSLIKIQAHDTYPRRTISFIQETINKLATIEWLGLCTYGCTNCPPGTVCP